MLQAKTPSNAERFAATPSRKAITDGAVRTIPGRVFHIETVQGEEGESVKLGAACVELELVWVIGSCAAGRNWCN